MDAKTFAANWAKQKDELIDEFLSPESKCRVQELVDGLKLDSKQLTQLRAVLDAALTDTMYGLLLGLDGEASIGGDQRTYRIMDADNEELIADEGELEAAAYESFHGDP